MSNLCLQKVLQMFFVTLWMFIITFLNSIILSVTQKSVVKKFYPHENYFTPVQVWHHGNIKERDIHIFQLSVPYASDGYPKFRGRDVTSEAIPNSFFFLLLLNIFWRIWKTKQLLISTDFHSMKQLLWNSIGTWNCLVTIILQNIFCI